MAHSRRRRAAPRRGTVPATTAPGLRGDVERRSTPLLVWFSARPKALLPLMSVVLLVAGLSAPLPWALVPLVLLLSLVAWLTYLSWPAVHGQARLVRGVTLGLLCTALVVKVLRG